MYSQTRNGPLAGSRDAYNKDDSDRLHSRTATKTTAKASVSFALKKATRRRVAARRSRVHAGRMFRICTRDTMHARIAESSAAIANIRTGVQSASLKNEMRSCEAKK